MDPERGHRTGFGLLVPAATVFALRALLEAFNVHPGDIPGVTALTILSGALSLVGLGFLAWASWGTRDRWRTLLPALVILAGHYLVRPLVEVIGTDLGAAMVYWGTGALAALRIRVAAWAGLVAAFGALMRLAPEPNTTVGEAFIVLGSGATAWFLVMAARGIVKK